MLKWKTHVKIARAVADILDIHGDEREALARGSIEPDKIYDYEWRVGRRGRVYSARVSHHKASVSLIMDYLYKARFHYIRGNRTTAMRFLGRAMHYIHDRITGKGFLGLFHGRVENGLLNVGINYYEIKRGARECKPLPTEIEKIISGLARRSNNPGEIMRRACFVSGYVSKAVVSDISNRELAVKYAEAEARHRKIQAISVLAGAIGFLFMYFFFGAPMAFSSLIALLLPKLDRKYYWYEKNMRWYSI